jgi:hypothetical protein
MLSLQLQQVRLYTKPLVYFLSLWFKLVLLDPVPGFRPVHLYTKSLSYMMSEVEEDEVGGTCGTNGREEERV